MSISIGSDFLLNTSTNSSLSATSASKIQNSLANTKVETSSDEELLEACKGFESYLVEQVFKEMKKTVPESDTENNEYIQNFGDMLNEEYARGITEGNSLGIAQMLYESMKR